jgi:hypothetical protein
MFHRRLRLERTGTLPVRAGGRVDALLAMVAGSPA